MHWHILALPPMVTLDIEVTSPIVVGSGWVNTIYMYGNDILTLQVTNLGCRMECTYICSEVDQ